MKIRLEGYKNGFEAISKKRMLVAIIQLVLILSLSKYVIHLFAWKVSGPISLMIGFLFLTFFLRRNGLGWSDLGFKKDKIYKLVIWFFISTIVSVAIILLSHEVADLFFDKPERANERFGDLSGNLPLTLAWILTGIVVGGFGEELVYRGFMINALSRVIDKRIGVVLSIVLPALFWAIRHYYYSHGYGSIMVFFMGIYFGTIYVLNGRNLLPGIILHSAFDTISFLARFDEG